MQHLCRFLLPCAAAVLVGAAPAGAVPVFDVAIVAGAGSAANDLNARGEVLGSMASGGASHAFLSGAAGLVDPGTLGGRNGVAVAIGERGQAVGNAQLGDGVDRGVIYAGGTLAVLPSASYTTEADINDAGVVTGSTSVAFPFANPQHAFTYANGTCTDLGVLPGGDGSFAAAVNNRGQAVGHAGPEAIGGNRYQNTAFLYDNGLMRDLGGLVPAPDRRYNSGATGIDNLGQIVGRAGVAPGREHAFLYDDGTMSDLNALIDPASGWEITNTAAINDMGQIAATACRGGLCYAARLDHVPAVPEPSVLALLGGGLALLGWRRRQAWGFTPLAPRCPG